MSEDLKKEIEELKKKLEECQKLKDEYLAGWQRARADLINYKKEELERVGELIKFSANGLILKILPILDNFEIAEKKLPENLKNDENVKGILQIKSQILNFLKEQGVEEIKSIGERFDPNFHEAIEEVSEFAKDITYKRIRGIIEEYIGGRTNAITLNHIKGQMKSAIEAGTVIEEVQKGYKLHERVIRPAKVKLAKNKILNWNELKQMVSEIELEIKEDKLFPYGPSSKEEKIKKIKEVYNILNEIKI
jgi:molecular chaperone GrpE